MQIIFPQLVYNRLKDVAEWQGRTKKDLIQDALIRVLGLEGVPIDDDTAYGKTQKEPETDISPVSSPLPINSTSPDAP